MSTKQTQAKKAAVAPNNISGGGEEDDLGVLIYKESQLRKAEAAAIAVESKKTSTASTHRRTSTRKRSPVNNQGEKSSPVPKRKGPAIGSKRENSLEEDRPGKR
jgi:hypothetical protein